MLLSQKAAEAEQEITRLRLGAMKVIHEDPLAPRMFCLCSCCLLIICFMCTYCLVRFEVLTTVLLRFRSSGM